MYAGVCVCVCLCGCVSVFYFVRLPQKSRDRWLLVHILKVAVKGLSSLVLLYVSRLACCLILIGGIHNYLYLWVFSLGHSVTPEENSIIYFLWVEDCGIKRPWQWGWLVSSVLASEHGVGGGGWGFILHKIFFFFPPLAWCLFPAFYRLASWVWIYLGFISLWYRVYGDKSPGCSEWCEALRGSLCSLYRLFNQYLHF